MTKRLLVLSLFAILAAAAPSRAQPPVPVVPRTDPFAHPRLWVQATVQGFEVRMVSNGRECPAIAFDGNRSRMTMRAEENADFPKICAAAIPPGTRAADIEGWPFPVPAARPQRIVVLGDTGCRIEGTALQDCNDPAKWPFPVVAQSAAALHPDLVLHLGDMLYRESACPDNAPGCAGSPHGDNWRAWDADFFAPAAPLLAAAPWVMLRGNHEECSRAGPGFLRLLGPARAYDPAAPCVPHLPPYTVSLGDVSLVAFDDAGAPDTEIDTAMLPTYGEDLAGLAAIARPVWLAAHRPIWAAVSGPLGIPIGGNATLIAAAGDALIPASVTLMLSGHIHSFEALNYDKGVPPQIVAGNGGDNLLVTPHILKGTIFQGHSGVDVTDGLSLRGFGFLLLTRDGAAWNVDLYDAHGAAERHCRFTPGTKDDQGRVDCPAPK